MIQRIQTLYLLLAACCAVALLVWPLAWFGTSDGELLMGSFALKSAEGVAVQSLVYLGVLVVLTALVPLLTIFLFRRRMLQIRLCAVGMVLSVGVLIMAAVYIYLTTRSLGAADAGVALLGWSLRPAVALPVASLLFAGLAARAIFRDELLVRGADRIR